MQLPVLLAWGPDHQHLPNWRPGPHVHPHRAKEEEMLIYLPGTVFSLRKYFDYCQWRLRLVARKTKPFPSTRGLMLFVSLKKIFLRLFFKGSLSAMFQMWLFLFAEIWQLVVVESWKLVSELTSSGCKTPSLRIEFLQVFPSLSSSGLVYFSCPQPRCPFVWFPRLLPWPPWNKLGPHTEIMWPSWEILLWRILKYDQEFWDHHFRTRTRVDCIFKGFCIE